MLVDHIEKLLLEATTIDAVVLKGDSDKALIINYSTDEFVETFI